MQAFVECPQAATSVEKKNEQGVGAFACIAFQVHFSLAWVLPALLEV